MNAEKLKELEKDIEEIKSEDILSLVVSIKVIERDIKYIRETIVEIKNSGDKFNNRLSAQEKDIGNIKIWFIPVAFMWTMLAAIIGWILKQKV